jgi:hypothetical protein
VITVIEIHGQIRKEQEYKQQLLCKWTALHSFQRPAGLLLVGSATFNPIFRRLRAGLIQSQIPVGGYGITVEFKPF